MKKSITKHLTCNTCFQLGEMEWASQKYGWEENDTSLPMATQELVVIRDLSPNSARDLHLLQCPQCKTYYLYESNYEYLVNGSEDEQSLKRLKSEEAEKLLIQPTG